MKKLNRKKGIKIILFTLVAFLFILVSSFFLYVSSSYKADNLALTILETKQNIEVIDQLTILSPSEPTDTALIFYPGAKVEASAYLPLLEQLRQNGIQCILVEMPFNLAVFQPNAAEDIFEKYPDIEHWYIGGHSLGGAMASDYASENKEKIDGLILLGAYIYGNYPPEKALTIYGTLNANLEEKINYTENIVVIEGGNHAQFGNYGEQKNDPPATITAKQQQEVAVEAILAFINRKE